MKLTWYGTAALVLECDGRKTAFDPFMKLFVTEPEEKTNRRREAFKSCKSVVITHGHFDHVFSLKELFAGSNTDFYLTAAPAGRLIKQGFSPKNIHIIKPHDSFDIGRVKFKVYKARHVRFDLKLVLGLDNLNTLKNLHKLVYLLVIHRLNRENGEIVGYELNYDGKRIFIMGSAELDADTQYPVGCDVLVLPHQGRSDIDEHNLMIIKKLRPKLVLLDHYDNAFPPMSSEIDCSRITALAQRQCPDIKIQAMIEGKTIEI